MESLEAILQRHAIPYAVVTSPSGDLWREHGSRSRLPFLGLVDGYLPGPDAAPRLALWLQGAPLPQVVAQGSVTGVFCRPAVDVIVAVFAVRPDEDWMTTFCWANDLAAEVSAAL